MTRAAILAGSIAKPPVEKIGKSGKAPKGEARS
jgi:hypothetical protein